LGRLAATFTLTTVLSGFAFAQACDDDSIESVSDDGAVIVMMSGATFRVTAADRLDTALWSAGDDVVICKDDTEIINKDENGERAHVRRRR